MDTLEYTIEKARAALSAVNKMRIQDIEGLAYVAGHTTDNLVALECIRRIKSHLDPLVENMITLYASEFSNATEDQILASIEKVEQDLRDAGFDPALEQALIDIGQTLD